jgi:hypothetical protein
MMFSMVGEGAKNHMNSCKQSDGGILVWLEWHRQILMCFYFDEKTPIVISTIGASKVS